MTPRVALVGLCLLAAGGTAARADAPSAPTIEFLEGDAGKKAIGSDSPEYFALLQPLEMTAKMKMPVVGDDLAGQREDCRRHYQEGVIPLTDEERRAVTAIVTKLHAAWATEYPLLARTPWSIIPVSDKVEGGTPHTRGTHVVLAQAQLHQFVSAAKKPTDPLAAGLCGLLAHEQAHVLQRRDPDAFAALYAGWGFVHAKDVATHPWLERQRATNPDGTDLRWVFPLKEGAGTTWIQPLAVFTEGPEPRDMPGDVKGVAVTLEKTGDAFSPKTEGDLPVMRDLTELPAYQDLWGGVDETFHPNEIFASLFAAMVAKDHFQGPDLTTPSDAAGKDFATLRAWCREHFSGKAASPGK